MANHNKPVWELFVWQLVIYLRIITKKHVYNLNQKLEKRTVLFKETKNKCLLVAILSCSNRVLLYRKETDLR